MFLPIFFPLNSPSLQAVDGGAEAVVGSRAPLGVHLSATLDAATTVSGGQLGNLLAYLLVFLDDSVDVIA